MTSRPLRIAVFACALLAAGPLAAASIRLQPDEAASKDVLLYQFNVPGIFGIPTAAQTTNLDSETLNAPPNMPVVPFGNFLGAAETEPFALTPGGPPREHGTRSLVEFDLSGLGLDPARVRKATFSLFSRNDLAFAFEPPTPDNPVVTDIKRVTEAWGEQTATWANQPAVDATPVASVVQSAVGRRVEFDVTELVRGWLADPSTNFGLQVSQRAIVAIPQAQGRDRFAASLFASSAHPELDQRPFLAIAPVPLPAPAALLAGGIALLAVLRRRRAA